MTFVRRLLTGILNDWSVSTPASAHYSAVTVTPQPYGASGRLTAAPWEGLQLDVTD
ncbi:hypothetical protein ACT4S2_17030 [Kocuria turfanensis]|uniref:hypothetical protein n=1 Tax=Kocuria turfanensis TaxID=388357 RepID=UPI0040374373